MACHFSGDYESNPTWKMKFDKKHYVKSVRFFNAQNGLNTSNIQGGQIFVDDKNTVAQMVTVDEDNKEEGDSSNNRNDS